MVSPIFLDDVIDHFLAPVHAEIHIDIRQGDAVRVEEALKQQGVMEWIQVGDAQRIGDKAAGGGASSWSNRNLS